MARRCNSSISRKRPRIAWTQFVPSTLTIRIGGRHLDGVTGIAFTGAGSGGTQTIRVPVKLRTYRATWDLVTIFLMEAPVPGVPLTIILISDGGSVSTSIVFVPSGTIPAPPAPHIDSVLFNTSTGSVTITGSNFISAPTFTSLVVLAPGGKFAWILGPGTLGYVVTSSVISISSSALPPGTYSILSTVVSNSALSATVESTQIGPN